MQKSVIPSNNSIGWHWLILGGTGSVESGGEWLIYDGTWSVEGDTDCYLVVLR